MPTTSTSATASSGTVGVTGGCLRQTAGLSDGCPAWVSIYASGDRGDAAVATALNAGGDRLYVTGFSGTPSSLEFYEPVRYSFVTAAYDARTGAELWHDRYNAPDEPTPDDFVSGVAVSPDGMRVYATGCSYTYTPGDSSSGRCRDLTIAYDSQTGHRLWTALDTSAPRGSMNPCAHCIATAADGQSVFIAGTIQPHLADKDYTAYHLTVAYDTATGAERWRSQDNDGAASDICDSFEHCSIATAMAVDAASGAVYITGVNPVDGNPAVQNAAVVRAFNPGDGSHLWTQRSSPHKFNWGMSVNVAADGSRVFLADCGDDVVYGCVYRDDAAADFAAVAFDAATGRPMWTSSNPGLGIVLLGRLSPGTDRLYVVGMAPSYDSVHEFTSVTLCVDALTGHPKWVQRYTAPGDTIPSAVSATGSGVLVSSSLFPPIAGFTSFVGPGDYLTVGYDGASGSTSWTGRYNSSAVGSDSDMPSASVASADGQHLYVTGEFVSGRNTEIGPVTGVENHTWGTVAWDVSASTPPNTVPDIPPALAVLSAMGLVSLAAAAIPRRRGTSRGRLRARNTPR